jgi:hypothetical protein
VVFISSLCRCLMQSSFRLSCQLSLLGILSGRTKNCSPKSCQNFYFFFLPFGISVFKGNLIHLSHTKKNPTRDCCITGVEHNLSCGILFQGVITHHAEKRASERGQKGSSSEAWVELL